MHSQAQSGPWGVRHHESGPPNPTGHGTSAQTLALHGLGTHGRELLHRGLWQHRGHRGGHRGRMTRCATRCVQSWALQQASATQWWHQHQSLRWLQTGRGWWRTWRARRAGACLSAGVRAVSQPAACGHGRRGRQGRWLQWGWGPLAGRCLVHVRWVGVARYLQDLRESWPASLVS